MHILIVHNGIIPAKKYGGTERIVLWLGKELIKQNHKVTFLVAKGSKPPFGKILYYEESIPLNKQIPNEVDIVHLHSHVNEIPKKPYVVTMHGNINHIENFDKNTIFVSKNHAERFGSKSYVYNGIDVDDYGKPSFKKDNYIHFLGDAAWRVKNVKGAIDIASKASIPLKVLGGNRLNISQGFRFTTSLNTKFYGMVGGQEKNRLLDKSKGLIFPVRWHEPFGLAIVESLYFGCPVFATPYGSLKNIINKEVGFLSNKTIELIEAIKNIGSYNSKICHEHVMENFTSVKMANAYIEKYSQVLDGSTLNQNHPCLIEVQEKKFLEFS